MYKIVKAEYSGDYKVLITFDNGQKRLSDFYGFISKSLHPSIHKYIDKKLFQQFKIEDYEIHWDTQFDIEPYDIYYGEFEAIDSPYLAEIKALKSQYELIEQTLMKPSIINVVFILFILLMFANLSLAQTSQNYHIDNIVRINRTNCSSLTQLSVLIPYPISNQYQTITDEVYLDGQLLSIPNSPNKYVRFLYTHGQLSDLGNIFDVTVSFNAVLHSFSFDFSQIGTIYPYNTSSNEYQQNVGASDVYIVPDHPTINSIAQNIWSSSTDIVDYARRCYEYVAQNYNYLNPNTGLHPLSELLINGGGDCGNLSSIYISLLRNKYIPSRHVVTIRPDGSQHVWAEFYLENYGWIPVDVTYKQSNPSGNYFGFYDGNGIIVSKGICLQLEKTPGDTYQCVLFQNYDLWYWHNNANLCNEITSQHIINSETQFYYQINTQSNNALWGETFGDGLYILGTEASVSAQPYENYTFVNWTENGTQVSTNANYTFTVIGNRNLVANFQAQPQQYTISVSANPSNGGSVSGGGSYNQGQSCTVNATANSGYTFVNWTENGTQVSSNASYTFTVNGNRNLVANFQVQAQQYTINVSASPSNGGSVSGGGTFTQGQTCTVNATANSGYTFVNWTENGTQVSTNANYTFTVTGNRSLVAHFQQQQQQYTISVSANPNNGGNVSGGGTYNQGASCTVHATANSGYTFTNWTENGTQVSTNPSYSFTVNGNRNLVVNFQAQTQQYTISVSANPNNGGSVSGGGTFNQGASCTVHATANNGYTFTNWTENGTQVSTNANYTFMVTGSRNLVANFSQSTYTITATAGANGFITPSGTIIVAGGFNQTFTIIPDYGYEINEVYVDGGLIGAPSSYTFQNVTSNHTIFATFIRIDGIDDNDGMAFVIYPNPTSGIVNILCQDAELFNIYNTYGQLLISQTTNGNDQVTIDISNLPSGIYLIQLVSKEGLATKQIIKIP